MKLIYASSRSCTVLVDSEGDYFARKPYHLTLNGQEVDHAQEAVVSVYGLWPDTEYELECCVSDGEAERLAFRTKPETCTFDVRRFGAKGDGVAYDTAAIQTAILCCPEGGRVLLPAGKYLTGPLFLKSHITIEMKKGAELRLTTDISRFGVLPGVTRTTDEQGEVLLGSWEGNPLDTYASALTGIGVTDVQIIGEGIVNGCAPDGEWWTKYRKTPVGPYRPRLFYLRDCEHITVQGITFRNSPAWNLHPTFSSDLSFLNVRVVAPADSPNTDGFDPESCDGIRMYGTVFSVGDDCIALKAGKIYMGMTYQTPCQNIEIAWCQMLDGHGGVTVGSEMSGGVNHVRVHHCRMVGNDRGLRIKTRRGRGKTAVIDEIRFEDVKMIGVKAPLVVNAMYYCDPDGKTSFVQSREKQPVDDGTPTIGTIVYERVEATDCSSCAAYILGLPERPVEEIALRDCSFSFKDNATPMVPAMANGVEACVGQGVIANYVKTLRLENVKTEGIQGERLQLNDVSVIIDA